MYIFDRHGLIYMAKILTESKITVARQFGTVRDTILDFARVWLVKVVPIILRLAIRTRHVLFFLAALYACTVTNNFFFEDLSSQGQG
jgi:hypothetical protein